MSGKVSGWVWDQDLPMNEKYVLLAYADHADHEGHNVFPSLKLIGQKTGYSMRSVRRITSELQGKGFLISEGGRRGGRKKSNRWSIPIYGVIKADADDRVSKDGKADTPNQKTDKSNTKADTHDRNAAKAVSSEPSVEPSKETSEEPRMKIQKPSLDQTPLAQALASIRMEFTNGNIYSKPDPVYDQVFGPLKSGGLVRDGPENKTTIILTHPDPGIFDKQTEAMLRQAFVGVLGGEIEISIVEETENGI